MNLEVDRTEVGILVLAMLKQRRHSRLYVNGFGNDRDEVLLQKLKVLSEEKY